MSSSAPKPRWSRRHAHVVKKIAEAVEMQPLPSVSRIARRKRDPFKILVSTVLSLRTKDEVTAEAARRLFEVAGTPAGLKKIPVAKLEKIIYPVGFYRTKARVIRDIARRLVEEFDGKVPDTVEALLGFNGVGRKTAALVVSLGFGKDAICVDTHVHRVSNRLGFVATSGPHQTETALMALLPRKYWIGYNELLVTFGQQVCTPVSPRCSSCPVGKRCPRRGVGRSR